MTTARADLPTIRIRRGPEAAAVVRAAARTVVAIGLLITGFVAYQFGVTSFLATRAQGALQEDLDARFASVETVGVPLETRDLPEAPYAAGRVPPFDPASMPGLDLAALEPFAGSLPGEDLEAPFVISEPLPLRGEPLGRIVIPSAGVDWTVVEGVTRADLRTGAGHMPDSALPGQQGNTVISGHRTTYGAPFLHLGRVEIGDPITVETATGLHVYQVVDSFVVDPSETWVTTQWEGAWLTLTTCEPVLSSAQRLVVVATLVAGPNAGVILAAQ